MTKIKHCLLIVDDEPNVCDSVHDAMLVGELFADRDLAPEEKEAILPCMLFADPTAAAEAAGEDFWLMVREVIWQAMGV